MDYKHIAIYEDQYYGRVNNQKRKEYVRCDKSYTIYKSGATLELQPKEVITKGCRRIGNYDGDSIMHYPTTLTMQVKNFKNQFIDEEITVLTLNEKAHRLCENGRCSPGQREGLSVNDVLDIASLYNTSCGRLFIYFF